MTILTDETLMAFADGELDVSACAAVETAMRDDPQIARRVAQHRALRAKVQAAFAAEIEEAPPEHLLVAARALGARPAAVSNIADARAAVDARAAAARGADAGGMDARPRWRPLLATAASVLLGVGIGYLGLRHGDSLIASKGGTLVATGALAHALSEAGGENPTGAPVHISLSFRSKSGDYCRVFTVSGAASPAGMACHHADDWQIRALAQSGSVQGAGPAGAAGGEPPGDYRTASSALPPLILEAVQQQIVGDPLDRSAERTARQQGWRSASP